MDHTWIEAVKSFKEFKKGEKYQVTEADAAELIEAGIAVKVGDIAEELFKQFSDKLDERDNQIVEKLSNAVAKPVNLKLPATAKSDEDRGSLGEFLRAVGKTSPQYDNKNEKEKAYNLLAGKYGQKTNLNQTTTTSGGFLVPEYWADELIQQQGYESAVFPKNCRLWPMQGHYLHLPTLDQTVSPSNGSSAFYGGVTVAVVAEGTAPAANTQPAFKSTQLTAKKILATCQVTNELLDNSPITVEPMVTQLMSDAVKADISNRAFNGAGGSTDFTGVINYAATISAVRKSANVISYRDVTRMYSMLVPGAKKRAKWFINPRGEESLFQLADSSGRAVYLQGFQSANQTPMNTLFGLEVIPTEALPSLGSTGDLVLFDPMSYYVGINKNITIDASTHYAFTSDIVTYRIVMRLDASPNLTAPIYLMNGTDQVSPFVQLSTTVGS